MLDGEGMEYPRARYFCMAETIELDIFAWQKISRKLDKNEEICRV